MAEEKNELDELTKLMKSKTVIVECSTRTDPYLAALYVAKEHKCADELRAHMENCLADWFDKNPEIRDEIKDVDLDKVSSNCKGLIYEKPIEKMNKHLKIIKTEISKYLDGTYAFIMGENGVFIGLERCSANGDNNPKRITEHILAKYIQTFFNHELYMSLLSFPSLDDNIKDNIFPELSVIVNRSITEICNLLDLDAKNIILNLRDNIRLGKPVEQSLYLGFATMSFGYPRNIKCKAKWLDMISECSSGGDYPTFRIL